MQEGKEEYDMQEGNKQCRIVARREKNGQLKFSNVQSDQLPKNETFLTYYILTCSICH